MFRCHGERIDRDVELLSFKNHSSGSTIPRLDSIDVPLDNWLKDITWSTSNVYTFGRLHEPDVR